MTISKPHHTNEIRPNIDPEEIARFAAAASRWWDRSGEFGALHDINTLRADYIASRAPLAGQRLLDVGCGGGILAEALARAGARVTGIDMGAEALAVAKAHARESGLAIDYRLATVEEIAHMEPESRQVVTCMELLEHVPRPSGIITACARVLAPGGHLFVATLNRTLAAWVLAIVAAEYMLGIVARGTHNWRRFIRPAELTRWAGSAGLAVEDFTGMRYIPFLRYSGHCRSTAVNYLAHFHKPKTQGELPPPNAKEPRPR